MKKAAISFLVMVSIFGFLAHAMSSGPVGVSPGGGTGDAVVGSAFPTFSWSSVEGAVGYRLEVYKTIDNEGTYQEAAERSEPILRVDIPGPALSWSPSAVEALQTGEGYVWYVKAVDCDGDGQWSAGNRFRIDANLALSGMEEAVKEKVREYVRTDTEIREAIREIKEEGSTQAAAGAIAVGTGESPEAVKLKGTEGDTITSYGLGAGTTGSYNTFIGRSAGLSNTTGSSNTFLGYDAGNANIDGNGNTFVGGFAGEMNSQGSGNTFMGRSSGTSNTDGNNNTLVGYYAGFSNNHGSGNVFVGYNAGYYETGSNRLYINNSADANPLIYGEFDKRILKINGSLSIADVSSPSDISLKRNIQPLDGALEKVASLKGVSYNWRTEEYPEKGFSRDRQIGLIAQDVEKVLPELVRTDKDGKKSVSYDKLTAVLVEAIKAQHGEIRTQESRLSAQNAEMENQKAKLSAQQAEIEELRGLVRQITSRNL